MKENIRFINQSLEENFSHLDRLEEYLYAKDYINSLQWMFRGIVADLRCRTSRCHGTDAACKLQNQFKLWLLSNG